MALIVVLVADVIAAKLLLIDMTSLAAVWKLVPETVNAEPGRPIVGVNEVIVGASCEATVNCVLLVTEPPGTVTAIVPLVAPVGTVATICVAVADMTVAGVPLNETES